MSAQKNWNVGTEPTAAGALLEEYTGIHCGNCPDGHRVAATLHMLNPGLINVVAVHGGPYAEPYPDEPNFATPEGEALVSAAGANSFPSASINRTPYNRAFFIGRSNWSFACREAVSHIAPINLYASSSYDKASRKLAVAVEGYTLEAPEGTTRLAVAIVQNNVMGPQSGGQVGSEYMHQHMLRKFLTDINGDPIEVAAGQYFEKEFEYDVPERIGDVDVDPLNLEVVAFVAKDDRTVLNSITCRPACEGMEAPVDVIVEKYRLEISKNYAFPYVELRMTNRGTSPVTSATFECEFNGEVATLGWEG